MQLSEDLAAVVTGGASGLGEATARALADQGARVALFDIDPKRGAAVAEAIGGVFVHVDVTSDASVARGFEIARAAHGQERVLVNCAGVGDAFKTAARDKATGVIVPYPMDRFRRTIEINLIGTFRCVSMSAAGMMTLPADPGDERGVIVNTASVAAQDGQMGQAAYAASKAGVAGMTLPVARDLSGEGIRVNAILPGIFDTPLLATAPDGVRASLGAAVLFPKRVGAPREFAHLVIAIIENGYFNGEGVRLDGAIRMAPR